MCSSLSLGVGLFEFPQFSVGVDLLKLSLEEGGITDCLSLCLGGSMATKIREGQQITAPNCKEEKSKEREREHNLRERERDLTGVAQAVGFKSGLLEFGVNLGVVDPKSVVVVGGSSAQERGLG